MIIRYIVFCAALIGPGFVEASSAIRPLPTPSKYASSNYAVAFDVPRNTTYCPLPKDWVGSDHGTTVFLEPPKRCYGAGFPSSPRGFEPAGTPRIDVFYAYHDDDDGRAAPCHAAGHARLFGRDEALCNEERDGESVLTVQGLYTADNDAEITLSLIAAPKDQRRYLPAFLALVSSVHTCREVWREKGKTTSFGYGPVCRASWF